MTLRYLIVIAVILFIRFIVIESYLDWANVPEKVRDIPRLIHQTYANQAALARHTDWTRYAASWVTKNREYNRTAWTDREIRIFLETERPTLLRTYDALPLPILRADMWRYVIINLLGDVYSDMDTLCLKPIHVGQQASKMFQ